MNQKTQFENSGLATAIASRSKHCFITHWISWRLSLFIRRPKRPSFDPSLHRFPDVNIDTIAANLNFDKRSAEDGRNNFPLETAKSLSSIELEAVEEVRKLRTAALNNYETELQAYANRVAEAKSDSQKISLMVGDAENQFINISKREQNFLHTPQVRVGEYQAKLDRFRTENDLVGPPRARANFFLALGLILAFALIEMAVNGYFFAKQNTMGWLGGVMLAAAITFVNVGAAYGFGVAWRFKNCRQALRKVTGYGVFAIFLAFSGALNLAVAHFRDALEEHDWQTSMFLAVDTLGATPLGLRSFESWVVLAFGAGVSILAFWKGYTYLDPYPGFNRVWDDTENFITEYATEYDDAQKRLDDAFNDAREDLEGEAQQHRARLKSAVDALFGQSTISRALDEFLNQCSTAATRLLRMYRESNVQARTDPAPSYFDDPFSFETYKKPKPGRGINQKVADAEIEKVEKIVKDGVDRLLAARRASLAAFPTVAEIKLENAKGHPALGQGSAAVEAAAVASPLPLEETGRH